jgi:hypothetical protein
VLTKPPHALTKPPHALTKPPHALIKPPHVLTKPPHVLTKPPQVLTGSGARSDQADAGPAHPIRSADMAANGIAARDLGDPCPFARAGNTGATLALGREHDLISTHVLNREASGVRSPLDR